MRDGENNDNDFNYKQILAPGAFLFLDSKDYPISIGSSNDLSFRKERW